MRDVERLQKARVQQRFAADLQLAAPFTAAGVHPSPGVTSVKIEGELAVRGGIHAKIRLEIVRAPALLSRQPGERGRRPIAVESIADGIEILKHRHLLRRLADRGNVDDIACTYA